MKAYGIERIHACCPGHDAYPTSSYRNRRSKKARARGKTTCHKRGRAWKRAALHKAMDDI